MAILRGPDGQFYEVPGDQLGKYLIPADKVKEKVQSASGEVPRPPPGGGPAIVVQIYGAGAAGGCPPPAGAGTPAAVGDVQPYGWWNTWRNHWVGCWHNVWHNVHP